MNKFWSLVPSFFAPLHLGGGVDGQEVVSGKVALARSAWASRRRRHGRATHRPVTKMVPASRPRPRFNGVRSLCPAMRFKDTVSARHRLNSAAIHGALGAAALIGAVTGSWGVFWLASAVLVATSLHDGNIRLGRRRR